MRVCIGVGSMLNIVAAAREMWWWWMMVDEVDIDMTSKEKDAPRGRATRSGFA